MELSSVLWQLDGRAFGGEWIQVCMGEVSLLQRSPKLSHVINQLYLNTKIKFARNTHSFRILPTHWREWKWHSNIRNKSICVGEGILV